MSSFALITEGITDQVVIERIIYTIVDSVLDEEPDVNILQPLRDATDDARQAPGIFGGWEQVLEFCHDKQRLLEALTFNDFLVIQLDTDCCEHPNFGISLVKDGAEVPAENLIDSVQEKLHSILGDEFLQAYGERLILAIAVHSTECWLMPFYGTKAHDKCREKSCEHHLTQALIRQNTPYSKTHNCYSKLCHCFKKHRDLKEFMKLSKSLSIFIENLIQKVQPTNQEI